MRKLLLPFIIFAFTLLLTISSCKNKQEKNSTPPVVEFSKTVFDSTLVNTFFSQHPLLKDYQSDVKKLYRKHQYHYVWYNDGEINEFGNVLYNKINNLNEEGIQIVVPYKKQLDDVYNDTADADKVDVNTELLNSSLYFFYADKVYHGLDSKKSTEMGWYLPRKKASYVNYLDSLLVI